MVRGEEETPTSRAGCRKGAPQESPTTSSLVVVMSMEQLRPFFQVPADISRVVRWSGCLNCRMGR